MMDIDPPRGGITEVGITEVGITEVGITEVENVEFTDQKVLRLRVVVYWGKEYGEPLYLVSHCPTGGEAVHWYKKRFRIETLFSDFSRL